MQAKAVTTSPQLPPAPPSLLDVVRGMRALGALGEESADRIPRSLLALALRTYADRIEALVSRERNAHVHDIHDALYAATGIPGNAAAMREALAPASS